MVCVDCLLSFCLSHIFCNFDLSASFLGNVVCGHFFFFSVMSWVVGACPWDNFMFTSAWGLSISVLRDTELGFLPQEAKDFHTWTLSCILN